MSDKEKIFICPCCYGEFVDEMTDAEKHEAHLEDFGEEVEASAEFTMLCGECYCEIIGKTPKKHIYSQVWH